MGAKKSEKKLSSTKRRTSFKPHDPKDDQIRLLEQQVKQLRSQLAKGDCSSPNQLESEHSNSLWPSHNASEAGLGHLYSLLEEGEYNELLAVASKIDDNHAHIGEVAYVVGLAHTRLQNPKQALIAYQVAQNSNFLTPYVLHNAAEACRLIQNLEEAIRLYKEALALLPQFQEAKLGLALTLRDCGDSKEAEEALRLLIRDHPDCSDASFHLANLLRIQGKRPEAIEAYYLCLNHAPRFPDAWNNLGLTHESMHQGARGLDCYYQALSIDSNFKESRQNLARALMRGKKHQDALRNYDNLLALQSLTCIDKAVGLQGKITCLLELGRYDDALAVADQQQDRRIQLMVRLYAIPVLYRTDEHLNTVRQQWSQDLNELHNLLENLTCEDPVWETLYAHSWAMSHFYLAYQMKNDRHLYEQYCDVLEQIMSPRLSKFMQARPQRERQHDTPIRVGIISPHLYNHNGSIWSLGWLQTMIENPKYELYSYNLSDIEDSGTERFAAISTYRRLSINAETPEPGLQQIIDDELDLLLFTNIGMHPVSRILSVLRLAPIQALGWGHPVTSGSKNIDVYFSGTSMETEDSDNHYSEKLWQLPNTGLNYPTPWAEDTSDQLHEKYQLPTNRPLINSMQSTFKYIPKYDWILAELASRKPHILIVMVNHMGSDEVIEQFKSRLRPHFERHKLDMDYNLRILPRLNHDDYLSMFTISRLTLDTIEWNGGNSSFQSFAKGCPVVTLPTQYMRGRHTASMLEMMDITDLITTDESDYLNRSCRLLDDEIYYADIKQKITSRSHRLFNDQSVATSFQNAVENLCRKS